MQECYRNKEADKKANSLLLKPRKPQTNRFYSNFTVAKAKTDAEICEGERMGRCIDIRNRNRK